MESSQGKAIPFVTFQERKGYVLTEEAEKFLNSLTETKIGVITVVGKYRTGKSFFINRVLLNQKKSGFSVGPTINPCTKVTKKIPLLMCITFLCNIGALVMEQDTQGREP